MSHEKFGNIYRDSSSLQVGAIGMGLCGGHGSKYYVNDFKVSIEIFANYCEIGAVDPATLSRLKTIQPQLCDILDSIIDKIIIL